MTSSLASGAWTSGDMFVQPVAQIPLARIAGMLREVYGIECNALERLTGERDQNFLVTDCGSVQYVLKVAHPSELPAVTDLQTKALKYIALSAPDLPVPRLVATQGGTDAYQLGVEEGLSTTVRLFTYLQGTPWHLAAPDARFRSSLGALQAKLDGALGSFKHPAASHDLLWDLAGMAKITPLLEHIENDEDRQLAEFSLKRYEEYAANKLHSLRRQVIHNDLNPYNILVDQMSCTVSGILDFGDIVQAPLLNDIAVAASYLVPVEGHPLEWISDYLVAYQEVMPLSDNELELLFPLVTARLVMTVAITNWRAALHPENRQYILRNNALSWQGLRRFATLTCGEAVDFVMVTALPEGSTR